MRLNFVIILAALVAACARDAAKPHTVATWAVDAKPVLEIATDDSVETIGRVTGVARFADGRMAVGDASHNVIKFYDSTGTFIRNVGGFGGGPGEFMRLDEVMHCGDSLYAHDLEQRSYTYIGADGGIGRRVSIALPDSVRSTNRSVCSANGEFLTAGWDAETKGADKTGPSRGPIPFWISNASGRVSASLGSQSGPEKWTTVFSNGIVIVNLRPLGKETQIALGKTKAYIGTADSGVIHVFKLDGTPLPPLRLESANVKVAQADIDAYNALDTIGVGKEGMEQWREMMKPMEYPATLPAYSALLVDRDQNVWVRAFPAAGAKEVTWFVFSEGGEALARLQLPVAFAIWDVGQNYLAGVESDVVTAEQRVLVLGLRRAK